MQRASQALVDEFDDLKNVVGTSPRGFSRNTSFAYPLVRADSLVTLNYGKRLVEKKRVPGTVRVYGTNGQCGWHNGGLVKGPGVILGSKGMGPLGVEWCESDFWVIDTAYYVTPRSHRNRTPQRRQRSLDRQKAQSSATSRQIRSPHHQPKELAYGDPSSNAESMAFRRAVARFGFGLYLYDKD